MSLALNNWGVNENVLYLNRVLHIKNLFFGTGRELCVLNVITLCECVIDLCVPQMNL